MMNLNSWKRKITHLMNNKLLYKDVFKDIDHIIHEKKDIIIVIDGKSGSEESGG